MVIKWIKSNILDLIQSAGLVGAAVVAFIAWLQSVPWYLALLGLLAAVVLILFGINQYEIRKERHKKLTQLSDKELENTIYNWVKIPAWSIQPRSKAENKVAGTDFVYDVTHDKYTVTIEHSIDEKLQVILSGGLHFPPQKAIDSDTKWRKLAGQIAIEMARVGAGWDFPGKPNKYDTLTITEAVILDDFITEYAFRERVMSVVRALILANEVWNQVRLGEPSTPDK